MLQNGFTLLFLVVAVAGLKNESEGVDWLVEANQRLSEQLYKLQVASWLYNTNVTTANRDASVEMSLLVSAFRQNLSMEGKEFDFSTFNSSNKRQFKHLTDLGTTSMKSETKLRELTGLLADMQSIYAQGKVDGLNLDPGISSIMAKSRDYDELLKYWTGWRVSSGDKVKAKYEQMVPLLNEAYRDGGYKNAADAWQAMYETADFLPQLEKLYKQLKPLYDQLHAYVRAKLRKQYGADKFPKDGHIPAHLLGNMWAQQWNNIGDLLTPYPNKQKVDVTDAMLKQNWTALKMFQESDRFFTSLGLKPMPQKFWDNSMITRPADREVVCHASAWDFYNGDDFRIKQCTKVTMEDLITVHHEMGHIQYYLQYAHQPTSLRRGANPGFHEAIGDLIALSVGTPSHLNKIGLLEKVEQDHEARINYLLSVALEKIAFLPFGYMMDLYRWRIFDGTVPKEQWNSEWWKLRCKYQGLSSPIARDDKINFDAGAKFHTVSNVPYIRYFVSFVIQFQFHKSLCATAGKTGPLDECDIYESKKAGDKLAAALRMGSSKQWQNAMEVMTGQREMDATPLVEYFKPLIEWLKEQNKNETIGWTETCPPDETPGGGGAPAVTQHVAFTLAIVGLLRYAM